jgi:hypothetical protein
VLPDIVYSFAKDPRFLPQLPAVAHEEPQLTGRAGWANGSF